MNNDLQNKLQGIHKKRVMLAFKYSMMSFESDTISGCVESCNVVGFIITQFMWM